MRTMLSVSVILWASACGGLPLEDGQATNNVTAARCTWPDGDSLPVCPSLEGLEVPADYAPTTPTNADLLAAKGDVVTFPDEMAVVGRDVHVRFGRHLTDGGRTPPTKAALFLVDRPIAAVSLGNASETVTMRVPAAVPDTATLSVAFFDESGLPWRQVKPLHVLFWKGAEESRSVIFTDRISRGSDNQLTFTGAVSSEQGYPLLTLSRPGAVLGTLDSGYPSFAGGDVSGGLLGLRYLKYTFSPAAAYEQELLKITVTDEDGSWFPFVQTETCFELDAAVGSRAVELPCP